MSESLPRQPAPRRAIGLFAAPPRLLAILLLTGALLCVAAEGRAQDPFDANDPLEDFNRAMFEVNQTIDRFLLKPIAEAYVFILPDEVRLRIANVLSNLSEPLNLVNNAAQGKFERAGSTLMRFTVNTTIGVGGIFDVAGEWGYERTPEDFGQTLAAWGIGGEPFLMLPLLGRPIPATRRPSGSIGSPIPSVICCRPRPGSPAVSRAASHSAPNTSKSWKRWKPLRWIIMLHCVSYTGSIGPRRSGTVRHRPPWRSPTSTSMKISTRISMRSDPGKRFARGALG